MQPLPRPDAIWRGRCSTNRCESLKSKVTYPPKVDDFLSIGLFGESGESRCLGQSCKSRVWADPKDAGDAALGRRPRPESKMRRQKATQRHTLANMLRAVVNCFRDGYGSKLHEQHDDAKCDDSSFQVLHPPMHYGCGGVPSRVERTGQDAREKPVRHTEKLYVQSL